MENSKLDYTQTNKESGTRLEQAANLRVPKTAVCAFFLCVVVLVLEKHNECVTDKVHSKTIE
jgi:hypothetical protein